MKKAVPMILSEDNFKQIFAFADRNSRLARLLYNAALFRIRQDPSCKQESRFLCRAIDADGAEYRAAGND